MQSYTNHYRGNNATQFQPLPGRHQVKNDDGAYVFAVDCWKRLDRFLILGSSEPTYYASARKLTRENAKAVEECIAKNARRTVQTIVAVSDAGRAPNNDPALFALAMIVTLADPASKLHAIGCLPIVARTGTHLFHFLQYATDLGVGWGRCFRNGVANWFDEQSVDHLALQAVKYKSRDGWSMRDVMRLAHPNPVKNHEDSLHRRALYRFLAGKEAGGLGGVIEGATRIANMAEANQAAKLITEYGLPRECVPTQFLNSAEVWEALLQKMPVMALTRNLAKMTSLGMLSQLSENEALVVGQLADAESIKHSRMHPIGFLKALMTYRQGHGDKGHLTWQPNPKICDALDAAFYLAFGNVEPCNKRVGLFLDVSGSMSNPRMPSLGCTPREASCAMAMITAKTEPNYGLWAFSNGMVSMTLTPRARLDDIVRETSRLPFSNTDCALPMAMAIANNIKLDAFVIYTDSETNSNTVQPIVALKKYRQKMGIDAKLIVIAMTSNGFSIADQEDGGCLDVVGMDTATPNVVSDFIRG